MACAPFWFYTSLVRFQMEALAGHAPRLYAFYTGLVYLTPMVGGFVADRYIGFRNAVLFGALTMTLGHAVLAFEMVPTFYLGIALLIIGNGLFKPNITPIVGQMYPDGSPLKDGAYTIFYMGVNAGAFLGILICGWLGETWGWSYGFGAAGIFMFFGALQFWFGQNIFGKIGLKPDREEAKSVAEMYNETEVPFERSDWFAFITFLITAVATSITSDCAITLILADMVLDGGGLIQPF